ncbi:hypothetical protein G6F68_013887 [Rhizopus microsporus]|nr:hypothetical protein G6F68_013887 [Rhizopus microsporus]
MGGATGMHAAATTLRGRISHLVVNDIGPELPQPAIDRILAYAGNPPAFDTVTELEAWLRVAYKPYGWQSDEQWRRMAETSVRRLPDGRVTAHYDPAIRLRLAAHAGAVATRRRVRSAAARCRQCDDAARAARDAHRLPRLRPCTRAERGAADRRHPPVPCHAGPYA